MPRLDSDPAFNLLLSEILEEILSSADNPKGCAELLARSLRSLIGAKTVAVLVCPPLTDHIRHEVLSIIPERRRALAESLEIQTLAQLVHGYDRSVLLDPEAADEYSEVLRKLDYGTILATPLRSGSARMGVLFFLDLMDADGLDTILETLDRLARVLALVIRNAFLYDNLERQVAVRTEALTKALREKEAMLKEVHHRVKNNLQIVNSLLNLQMDGLEDPVIKDVLRTSQDRIRSMALVHEELYGANDLASVDLLSYIPNLCGALEDRSEYGVSIHVSGNTLRLPISEALPCGLIITELITNGIKYAYPNHGKGELRISIGTKNARALLAVEDDGVGLPPGYASGTYDNLGMTLIRGLTAQLNGTFTSINRADIPEGGTGTRFELSFPVEEAPGD